MFPCGTCLTTGKVPNPIVENWHNERQLAGFKVADPKYWEGEPITEPDEIGCGECDGIGYQATEAGKQLSEFMARFT